MLRVGKSFISSLARHWTSRFVNNNININNSNLLKCMTIRSFASITNENQNQNQIDNITNTITGDKSVVLRLIRKRKVLSNILELPMNTKDDKKDVNIPIISTMSELKLEDNKNADIVEVKDLPSQTLIIKPATNNNNNIISQQEQRGGSQIVYVYAPVGLDITPVTDQLKSEWKLYNEQPNVIISKERMKLVDEVMDSKNDFTNEQRIVSRGSLIG